MLVGYDGDDLILRSETEQRRAESYRRFTRSWERGGRWSMVALPPGVLPASATAGEVVRAVEDARTSIGRDGVMRTLDAAVARWPADPLVLFASADEAYARGDPDAAINRYRSLTVLDPDHLAARNNLASLLLARGCADSAERAFGDAGGDALAPEVAPQIAAAVKDTAARIARARADSRPADTMAGDEAPRCP
ncbi:MAG: hypothetical protein FJ197_04450 [Gammaproteobacteria bacterium]|nr:hypothetical protein [Gammaproteobacteria bacterium]